MHSVSVFRYMLRAALLTLAACSSAGEESADDPAEGTRIEHAAALCAKRCDKEIATRCDSTPVDRRSACIAGCTEKYDQHPDCSQALTTLDGCRAVGGTYTCDAAGMPLLGPVGLCESELQECMACTAEGVDGCR